MKYLVTGGAGFIGSHLLKELKGEVVVLDDLTSGSKKNIPKGVKLIEGTIEDPKKVAEAMKGVDYVIHLAARLNVPESVLRPRLYCDVNIKGTINLLEAARHEKIKKFVFISSAANYGESQHIPLKEDAPAEPISPYGATKAAGEHYCQAYHHLHGVPTICLRYFNVYGPGQKPDSPYAGVISIFINKLLKGQQPTIFGDGTQTRDYIYVKDVVEATLRACHSDVKDQIINVGTAKSTSVEELARTLIQVTGKNLDPIYEKSRPGDVQDSLPDVSKAEKLLRFKAKIDLEQGLRKTIKSF